MHAAALIEEPLCNDLGLGRNDAQDPLAFFQVGDQLPAGLLVDARFVHDPLLGLGMVVQPLVDAFPELGDFLGQLPGAAGRFSQPERNRWRLPLGILHPDLASLNPPDLPGCIPQQEHVSGKALDGEVLVDRAYKGLFWVENDIVVGVVGDRAATGHGRYGCAAPAFNLEVYAISMQERPAPSLPESEPLGQDFNDLVELFSGQFPVGIGFAAESK